MIRIVIISASVKRGDGQGRANYEIVREAASRGHLVQLVAREVDPDVLANGKIVHVSLPESRLPSELIRGTFFARRAAKWVRANQQSIDAILTYGSATLASSDLNACQFVQGVWLRSPFRRQRHRSLDYNAYQWAYTAFNARREKAAYSRARIVIAVSEKIKEDLVSIGVPRERIRVILNGVDLDEFTPARRERKDIGLPPKVPMALFAGDIRTGRKNLDSVLRALAEVPGLHLAIAGSTNDSPYPALAKSLGVADRAHFLGFRKDIAAIMQSVDFFVFPSRYEACTLVLMEAMASGLPVITARTAGGSEVVQLEAGYVLENPDDVLGLVQAMRLLASDTTRRQAMGRSARLIAERHSWKSKASAYVDLLEECARVNRSGVSKS